MQRTDLRIGSYVYSDGIMNTVENLLSDGALTLKTPQGNYIKSRYELIKPILLTEKIHNQFGVTKNGFNNFEYELPRKFNIGIKVIHTDEYVMLRQGTSNPLEDDVISVWNKDVSRRDMYVHEWQNLYFALCGGELTIKELTKNE